MKNIAILATAVATLLMSGCAATGDDYKKGVRPSFVMHPVLGQLNVAEEDLLGPDANRNGVRDEVDLVIQRNFAAARAQATRYSAALTQAMLTGLRGQAPQATELQNLADAAACLEAVAPGAVAHLEQVTTRTPLRAQALQAWRERVGTLPAGRLEACASS